MPLHAGIASSKHDGPRSILTLRLPVRGAVAVALTAALATDAAASGGGVAADVQRCGAAVAAVEGPAVARAGDAAFDGVGLADGVEACGEGEGRFGRWGGSGGGRLGGGGECCEGRGEGRVHLGTCLRGRGGGKGQRIRCRIAIVCVVCGGLGLDLWEVGMVVVAG